MDAKVDLAATEFAQAVRTGFSQKRKGLSSKYFYDDRGSELFQAITKHPDYYLTRAEHSILEGQADGIYQHINVDNMDIVELGAGDGHKTELLLSAFAKRCNDIAYCPIDISAEAIRSLEDGIELPANVTLNALVADHFTGLDTLSAQSARTKLLLFLGSSIGNYNTEQAISFLKELSQHMQTGDFALVGFDLKKDIKRLNRAYNDSAGITADFNLNLLTRINRELGGEFELDKFEHYGAYNPIIGAMESFLVSRTAQSVDITDLDFTVHFAAWEPIHLEYSYKYLPEDILAYAGEAGFEVVNNFYDSNNAFCDSLWRKI